MLSIYEAHEEHPVKCRLYAPVYSDNGMVISHTPTDIFCFCEENGFETDQTKAQNRRYVVVKGALTTKDLKKDEINIDWKIEFDGDIYIIERMNQKDDKKQQVYTTNPVVITTLYVRR